MNTVTQVGDRPFRAEQPLEVVLVEARHRGVGGGTPSRAVDRAHMSVVARDRRRIGDERVDELFECQFHCRIAGVLDGNCQCLGGSDDGRGGAAKASEAVCR